MPKRAKTVVSDDAGQDVWTWQDVGQGQTTGQQDKGQVQPADGEVYLRRVLSELLADPSAPPAAKASATRTLAEMDGLIGRFQQAPDRARDVPAHALSRADLVTELARLRRSLGTKGP
jgi:hypothetical protein